MDKIIGNTNRVQDSADAENQILTDCGFYWRESGGVKVLVAENLERAGFVNGFSTRLGGVSPFPDGDLNLAGFDDDSAENIAENRRRFISALGGGLEIAAAWQVHGDTIKVVHDLEDAANSNEKADALISDLDGLVVGVKTADCVPVLVGDPKTGAYAAVHAGWRGTASSIASKVITALNETFGCEPVDLVCAIGPAACGRSYEIGHEVIAEFEANFTASQMYFSPSRPGHAFVDLHLANRDQLVAAGVQEENISVAPLCTMERTDLFFSYRREKAKYGRTGRLLSVIGHRGERLSPNVSGRGGI